MFVQRDYYNKYRLEGLKLTAIVSVLVVFNIIVGYITMRWIDEPIRKKLKAKFQKK